MNRILSTVLILFSLSGLVGCSKFFGDLRRDLDDSEPVTPPTYGGTWTERGLLSDEFGDIRPNSRGDYKSVGHNERSLASAAGDPSTARDQESSWVSQEDVEGARRDFNRRSNPEESGYSDFYSKAKYKNGNRATRADFVDESPNEGSLWASDGQTNYYFTKNKIRGVGDIVTVNMENNIISDLVSEIRRTLTEGEKLQQIALAQERNRQAAIDAALGADKNGNRAPAAATGDKKQVQNIEDIKVPEATVADIDISKVLEVKAGETMMAEIIQRYPNGNYKIRAVKNVKFKGGYPRQVQLIAIAKSSDIAEDDTILSGKLYEYRLQANR